MAATVLKVGVVFPQTEIGADPVAVQDFVQAVEDLGYNHVLAYDHVLGADPAHYPGWRGAYNYRDMFHEPLVLYGYLAAITRRIELVTGIIILPQRQTALVAKQAAEVDVLSGGRLRLGVGLGWNPVEYEALGEDFHNRGRRIAEQIALLRLLWTQEVVTFQGKWHKVTAAGINPLPVQRPIPIWMGGSVEPALRRIARLADGWFPQVQPTAEGRATIQRFRQFVLDAGRDPAQVGIEGRIRLAGGNPETWSQAVSAWQALDATHVSLVTMGAGLTSPQQHIELLRRAKEALAL